MVDDPDADFEGRILAEAVVELVPDLEDDTEVVDVFV